MAVLVRQQAHLLNAQPAFPVRRCNKAPAFVSLETRVDLVPNVAEHPVVAKMACSVSRLPKVQPRVFVLKTVHPRTNVSLVVNVSYKHRVVPSSVVASIKVSVRMVKSVTWCLGKLGFVPAVEAPAPVTTMALATQLAVKTAPTVQLIVLVRMARLARAVSVVALLVETELANATSWKTAELVPQTVSVIRVECVKTTVVLWTSSSLICTTRGQGGCLRRRKV